MPATLGLIAVHRRAGMAEFDHVLRDQAVRPFLGKVEMRRDAEVDAAYPTRWIGKVTVETTGGRTITARVDEPKGDPGNTLSRAEIDAKVRRLALYGKGVEPKELDALMPRLWAVAGSNVIGSILGDRSA
jgi:2-methylcitrate dehydratase PrpD